MGAAFVVGDEEEVLQRSTQLMPNPFEGHDALSPTEATGTCWRYTRPFVRGLRGSGDGRILAGMRSLATEAKALGLGIRHWAGVREGRVAAVSVPLALSELWGY
jgi:hypothetical protein